MQTKRDVESSDLGRSSSSNEISARSAIASGKRPDEIIASGKLTGGFFDQISGARNWVVLHVGHIIVFSSTDCIHFLQKVCPHVVV